MNGGGAKNRRKAPSLSMFPPILGIYSAGLWASQPLILLPLAAQTPLDRKLLAMGKGKLLGLLRGNPLGDHLQL